MQIDWAAPWLAPYVPLGPQLAAQMASGQSCPEVLNGAAGQPIAFVDQSALPVGMAYEQFIFDTRQVPTRDNPHDFFNGLCWLHFPQTKTRLNQLQAAQIAQDGIGQVRGAARDALTLFDENAAFFAGPDALWHALSAKDWAAVFGTLRPLWQQTGVILFGHALLEKLLAPRKPITAHVYRVPQHLSTLADIDTWMARELSTEKLAAKPFAHLPVLGVPDWWPANADPAFYADASVFRPPRQSP